MAQSDMTIFLENLKMWDRPEAGAKGQDILKMDDNIDQLVDEMFEHFCDLEMDRPHPLVGNC